MGVHTNASMKDTVQNGPLGSFCVKVPPHLGIILHERSLLLDIFDVVDIISAYAIGVSPLESCPRPDR